MFSLWNGIFKEGMMQSKSPVTLLSFSLQLVTDQTFQMRYKMFMNSQWLKNDQPSKLEVRIKFCLNKEIPEKQFFLFFQLWQLVIFEPPGVQER